MFFANYILFFVFYLLYSTFSYYFKHIHMRTLNFARGLNWVWVLALAAFFFTACNQMDGLEPDGKTLEENSANELFRLSPFGDGLENARVIGPVFVPDGTGGNVSCTDAATTLGVEGSFTSFPAGGTGGNDFNGSTFASAWPDGFTITVREGKYVDWKFESDEFCLTNLIVIVKGGPGANAYYFEGVTSGTDLRSPNNPGGQIADLSNLRICYNLEKKPDAPIVEGAEDCFEEGLVLRATSNDAPAGYTVQWYTKNDQGEFVPVPGNDPKLDKVGTIDYYAAFVNGCSSDISEKPATLTIWALPAAPKSKGDQEEEACDFKKLTASVEVAPGTKIVWYDAPTGGNVVENPSLVYDEAKGGTQTVTFYAEAVNTETECVSATRTAVKLTLNPCPPSDCWTGESATGKGSPFPTGSSTWFEWNTRQQLIDGVDLVYGRNLVPIGRVTLSGGKITVTLNEGIRFAQDADGKTVSGALKVIASNTQFTSFSGFRGALSNATINGNTATISVPDRPFYFVHGDIERIIECSVED
ncbi:hypothetical protein B879_03220 [Cecembia lonarensis LW9]|uniref:Ig-like domain-containing protein n=2 Tax=Cecembia TaxID=1187078 RepID=K1LVN1_CECL9|nr:hypothetical protein B879_03220 [Cecembia lonarensis LW9]